jgi:hypothetical protein
MPITNNFINLNAETIHAGEIVTDRGILGYNVKAYGAVGDGITDDTASIQAAIDAAEADNGGTIIVDDGTYLITDQLTVQSSYIEFHLSINATIKADATFDPGGNDFMLLIGEKSTQLKNVTVSGFGTFDANNITSTDGVKGVGVFGATEFITLKEFSVINTINVGGVSFNGGFVQSSATDVVETGQAQAGAETTITLAAGASATDDDYNGHLIFLIGDTGAGQVRWITDYDGTTKVATVNDEWFIEGDATTDYVIINPGKNNTISGIKLNDFSEGILFQQQYNGIVESCIADTSTFQDIIETNYCYSCAIVNNVLTTPGSGNACIDVFNVNVDIMIANNVLSSEVDHGSSAPGRGITTSNNNAMNAGIVITNNSIGGSLNRGIEGAGTSGVSHGNAITNNKFSCSGQAAVGIYLNGATYDMIQGNTFEKVGSQTGGAISGRAIQVNNAASNPCLITGNTFMRSGQADIHFTVAPTSGETWDIINNRFVPGSLTLWAVRQEVTGIPVHFAGNVIESAYVTNEIRVNAGTGNMSFGLDNRGALITDNRGLATSIATTGTVAHGLSETPDYLSCTINASSATPTDVVFTADATNITATYGGGGTIDFFWEARVLVDNGSI